MTIANVLNKNKDNIFQNISDISKCKQVILNLLDSSELKDNKDVPKARNLFSNCKNQKLFLTCLTTYMTCINVSEKKNKDLY